MRPATGLVTGAGLLAAGLLVGVLLGRRAGPVALDSSAAPATVSGEAADQRDDGGSAERLCERRLESINTRLEAIERSLVRLAHGDAGPASRPDPAPAGEALADDPILASVARETTRIDELIPLAEHLVALQRAEFNKLEPGDADARTALEMTLAAHERRVSSLRAAQSALDRVSSAAEWVAWERAHRQLVEASAGMLPFYRDRRIR